jgi:hypothetical protein
MHRKIAAATGGLAVGFVCGLFGTGVARGAQVTGNYTAGYDINHGYSEVSSFTGTNVATAGVMTSGGGPVDMFFEVANNGGGTTHAYTVTVTNISNVPITGYRFQVGTSNLNWYLNANVDADQFPDYLDSDMDNDGVANAQDNALWVQNLSQSDLDGDGWGDVMDFAPANANVPLNQVGGQAPVPMTPTSIPFNFAPQIDFINTPTSNAFGTFFVGPGDLIWSNGSIAPGATETFTFELNVREMMPNDGFVLRQIATVPEPACGVICGAALLVATRRRRGR